jgi:hypothetical protein
VLSLDPDHSFLLLPASSPFRGAIKRPEPTWVASNLAGRGSLSRMCRFGHTHIFFFQEICIQAALRAASTPEVHILANSLSTFQRITDKPKWGSNILRYWGRPLAQNVDARLAGIVISADDQFFVSKYSTAD